MLHLPQNEVHEEDYSKKQHGQSAAHLSNDRELFQLWAGDGFIERSLKGTKARDPLLLQVANQVTAGFVQEM